MRGSKTPESLFADYLKRVERGEDVDFEAWADEHSNERDELRRLYLDWQQMGDPHRLDEEAFSFFGRGDAGRRVPGLSPGSIIGDFELIELIDRGGMGEVWEARQLSLGGRQVALKFVRPERVTPKLMELFQREARAGGRLSHAGIVSVYGCGEAGGLSWIAMEYVEGCWTLRSFLDEMSSQEALPRDFDRRVAGFVADIADAMQAAHDVGVIHRDLKPRNILVHRDERPKITDFGLARITDESALSRSGDLAGTFHYMSPEQVAARRMGLDHRTDIFSLGVVMYEMLTLRRPFEGDTSHQIVEKILTRDPEDPQAIRSQVPHDLATVCLKALEKDRSRRYRSMADLAEDLRRHLRHDPVTASRPTQADRLRKWVRRNPAKASAGAVGIGASAAILGLLVWLVQTVNALEAKTVEADQRYAESQRNRDLANARAEELGELNEALRHANEEARTERALAEASKEAETQRLIELRESNAELVAAREAEKTEAARARRASYFANLAAAALNIDDGNLDTARQQLEACPAEYRRWEWGHLRLQADPSRSFPGTYSHLKRTPSGVALLLGTDSSLVLMRGDSPEDLRAVWETTAAGIRAVSLSAAGDSAFAATDDGRVLRWDTSSGEVRVLRERSVPARASSWTVVEKDAHRDAVFGFAGGDRVVVVDGNDPDSALEWRVAESSSDLPRATTASRPSRSLPIRRALRSVSRAITPEPCRLAQPAR